ncbi:hypothetical protein LZ32DRAFT_594477 [Colletotrichum eremochloae]|nr:hypothetical protein LZ32DRAFT_594477 [Colletotrichum eremochloae]
MLEAVRIMNSLVIPAEVVNMLAEAGWDAAKCCNPKLTREEKRLGAEPAELKRSIEDEDESSSQAKKQKATVAVSHQKRFKTKNSAIEIPVPTDQNSLESSLVIPEVLVKTEEELPMPAIPRSTSSLHVYNAPGEKSENGHLSNYSYQGSNGILRQPSVVPNTSDNVSNSLTVKARLREHSENIEDHSNQLRKYTKKLRRQKSALAQLRHDNQALRECLQEALLPLAQVVNVLRKSNKDDKRAFKSAKKRAERGLKEFKSAAKDTEALRQSFEHLRCIIGTAESRHGGKNHSRGQED